MTTNDKTGDQLMASIHKTKAEGANSDSEPAETPQAAPATRPTVKKAAPKAKDKEPETKSGTEHSGYQLPGRVWPD